MSNFPPGVTGNEYAIAGADYEEEEHRECEEPDVTVTVKLDAGETQKFRIEQCQFAGEVLVQGYRGRLWWTCPACGTEHEEDADEPDGL